MTIGERIKRIRLLRGMTQWELGVAVGFDERSADTRIAQYETNYRVPKENTLDEIAKVLQVNRYNLYIPNDGLKCAEDLILALFWLEEDFPGFIHFFDLVPDLYLPQTFDEEMPPLRYYPSGNMLDVPKIGMYFSDFISDSVMKEWKYHKEQLQKGEITKNEYFDWKLNWPKSSDGGGQYAPTYQWKKSK